MGCVNFCSHLSNGLNSRKSMNTDKIIQNSKNKRFAYFIFNYKETIK